MPDHCVTVSAGTADAFARYRFSVSTNFSAPCGLTCSWFRQPGVAQELSLIGLIVDAPANLSNNKAHFQGFGGE
ncbi:MAG: hypothetical protein HC808_19100 [Candidatus Competibacteraceae bacterium]|nr:hypothetical protein [Candidatus Competibacteraceae bacterium]NJN48236.1 hypothetical protein [Candidatus Competibacteraceae bacterium]